MTFLRMGQQSKDPHKGYKLTPKMMSFIDAYVGEAYGNGRKAVELSEYNCKTPRSIDQTYNELIRHPLVTAEIERRLAERSKKAEVRADYLIGKLMDIIDDVEDVEKTADRLRAIELAGKSIAFWKERQEISGPDGEAIQHEEKIKENAADFTRRISGLAKRAGASGTNVVDFPRGDGTT